VSQTHLLERRELEDPGEQKHPGDAIGQRVGGDGAEHHAPEVMGTPVIAHSPRYISVNSATRATLLPGSAALRCVAA